MKIDGCEMEIGDRVLVRGQVESRWRRLLVRLRLRKPPVSNNGFWVTSTSSGVPGTSAEDHGIWPPWVGEGLGVSDARLTLRLEPEVAEALRRIQRDINFVCSQYSDLVPEDELPIPEEEAENPE